MTELHQTLVYSTDPSPPAYTPHPVHGLTISPWTTPPRSIHLPPTLYVHQIKATNPLSASDPALYNDHAPSTDDRGYRALRNLYGWHIPEYTLYPDGEHLLIYSKTLVCQNDHRTITLERFTHSLEGSITLYEGFPAVSATQADGQLDLSFYYETLTRIHQFLNTHFLAVSTSRSHWTRAYNEAGRRVHEGRLHLPFRERFFYNPANYCDPSS